MRKKKDQQPTCECPACGKPFNSQDLARGDGFVPPHWMNSMHNQCPGTGKYPVSIKKNTGDVAV